MASAPAPIVRRTELQDEFSPPFVVVEPASQTRAFVFNAPHAGDVYPPAFLQASPLDATALRRSEDAFVDRLVGGMVALGAPLMSARFPRMFEGRLPPYANTRSMRVAGGLGTVPRIVADGHDIYRGRLSVDEALARIEGLYKPYHRMLRGLLKRTADLFGHVVLVDCHSMPSGSFARDESLRADIVLGDRYGTSCRGALTDLVESTFRAAGYAVVRNKPYAGGFITEHYGAPALGRHALQVEINRALYMDERTLEPLPGFADIANDLAAAFAAIMDQASEDLEPRRMAAE